MLKIKSKLKFRINKEKIIVITIIFCACVLTGLIITSSVEKAKNKQNEVVHKNVLINENLNEYGFYFDKIYSADYETNFKACVMFTEDEIMYEWLELNPKYYEKNKDQLDKEFNSTTYEEANEKVNELLLGNKDGLQTQVKYDYLSVIEDRESSFIEDVFFSEDGKRIYNENDKKRVLGNLEIEEL